MRAFPIALTTVMLSAMGAHADEDLLAYGEYLAGECASCHINEASASAIPVIAGIDAEYFIEAMTDYQLGERENPAMETVARSLDDDQLVALGAYFANLPDPFAEPEDVAEAEAKKAKARLDAALTEARAALGQVEAAQRALAKAKAALEDALKP